MRRIALRPVIWLALSCLMTAGCPGHGKIDDPWPSWRGAQGLGVAEGVRLPLVWSTDSANIRWRTRVEGLGNSSPVVSGGLVFLTTSYGDAERLDEKGNPHIVRAALAVDLETGDLRWRTPVATTRAERKHALSSFAAPTPVARDGHVFVYFGSHLARLDAEGKVVWNHEVDSTYVYFGRYGAASSPILADDLVIVFQDREYAETDDIGWLAAFDTEDGHEVWRNTWIDSCCAYSTPVLRRDAAGPFILVAHSGAMVAYDARTGAQLWDTTYPMLQMVTTPVIENDLLCASGGGDQERGTVCWQLAPDDRKALPVELWSNLRNPSPSSSPVLTGGLLFTVTDQGLLSAWDARTGERRWRDRLVLGSYRGSLLAGDGRVYINDTHGRTSVVRASERFEKLAQNELGPGTNASPAVAGGCLLIRTAEHLVCIEAEAETAATSG